MEDEDGGVLGNLPRSRPGTRSEKREGQERPAVSAERAAERAERRDGPAARPSSGGERRAGAPQASSEAGDDPIRGAVRLAARTAVTGVQVAGAVSREVLRRLPRP